MVEILSWIFGVLFFGSIIFRHFFTVSAGIKKSDNNVPIEELAVPDLLKENQLEINKAVIGILKELTTQDKKLVNHSKLHQSIYQLLQQLEIDLENIEKRLDTLENGTRKL